MDWFKILGKKYIKAVYSYTTYFTCMQSTLCEMHGWMNHKLESNAGRNINKLFATAGTAARQASLSITNSQSFSNTCPSSRWCHPTISSPVVPFSVCLIQWVSSSHQVAKVLELQMAEKKTELKNSWWQWKRRVKKLGLKLNIQKTKIMASGPIASW